MPYANKLVNAVVLEGRPQAEVAHDYEISKGWISKLVTRYRIEGDAAFEPHSRRPKHTPNAIPTNSVQLILNLRQSLTDQELDAGPTPSPGT